MFVILDGEAQFTIDGRTASVKGPAGVLCRTGHSHAIYNPGPAPVQWMNLNVSLIAGVYDNFDLGDTRVGAALDAIPTFMTMRLDKSLLRAAGARGRGAATPAPAPNAVLSRRVAGPAMFSTTWSYVDHVLVPPGATTPELPHDSIGEAYYVLGGEGTISVAGATSGTAAGSRRRRDSGSPRRVDPVHQHRLRAARTVRDGRGQGHGREDAVTHRARRADAADRFADPAYTWRACEQTRNPAVRVRRDGRRARRSAALRTPARAQTEAHPALRGNGRSARARTRDARRVPRDVRSRSGQARRAISA